MGPPPRARTPATAGGAAPWVLVALAGSALLAVAFGLHRVGDYYTESDFYGGYAEGARLIQQGRVDPSRYPVVGPVYEFALALVGFAVPDLFAAGRLISVAAAVGTLAVWYLLLARRAGPAIGLWTIALVAVNPVFVRYGYSATTDMLGTFLASACIFAALGSRSRGAPFAAGLLAALATLTRYNAVALVPAALVCALAPGRAFAGSRPRAAALFLAGFAVLAGPWSAFSLSAGHPPGASLVRNYGFYFNPGGSRNVQDRVVVPDQEPQPRESLLEVVGRDPRRFVTRTLAAVPDHLARDARELLGWPAAALVVVGAALGLGGGLARRLAPPWVMGAALFAGLLFVFYSDRYSLPLLPVYLSLAAAAIASRRLAVRVGATRLTVGGLAAIGVVGLTLPATVAAQARVLGESPIEVIEAGRALARAAGPEARVVSRKGHIGYYSGLRTVPFPRFRTLRELADHARGEGAGFLYFSWYECLLRQEFAYLLDPATAPPGLAVVHATERRPSVTYRIGPGFGEDPPWMADPFQRAVRSARVLVRVLPDTAAWRHHTVLAVEALQRGRLDEALVRASRATAVQPADTLGWVVQGQALLGLDRPEQAAAAYARALALDPGDFAARFGLGAARLSLGDREGAGRAWRPIIPATRDRASLERMARLYEELDDREAAGAARARLQELRE